MKTPPFLTNLYRDLQDRRLLPLVGILAVATLALPFLLSQDSNAPAPPPPPAVAGEDEIPTLPAVLASDPGLRDYRKRLDSLDSKDPFKQQFAESSQEAIEGASVSEVDSAVGETYDSSGASAGSAAAMGSTATGGSVSGSTASGTVSDTSTTSTTSTGSESSSSGGGSQGGGGGTAEARWFTYRIDVTTGRAGDAEERKDVRRGTVLPSQANPVAMFLGVGESGNRAQFLVSEHVVQTHGEGQCVPSPSECTILAMKVGHERTFDYAPNGEPDAYVIKLDAIRLVEVDEPKGAPDSDRQAQSAGVGLRNFLGL